MATVGDVLKTVSRLLNDSQAGYEFARWDKPLLLSILDEALMLISIYKPDEFTEIKIIKLQAGSDQTAECCKKVLKVYCQTDEYGNAIGAPLMKVSNSILARWSKKDCEPTRQSPFLLSSYILEDASNVDFSVRPPVPREVDVYVRVLCQVLPTNASELNETDDIGLTTALPAAYEWCLYRAMIIDDESQTASTIALRHLETFFELMKVQYTREHIAKLGNLQSPEAKSEIASLRASGLIGKQV